MLSSHQPVTVVLTENKKSKYSKLVITARWNEDCSTNMSSPVPMTTGIYSLVDRRTVQVCLILHYMCYKMDVGNVSEDDEEVVIEMLEREADSETSSLVSYTLTPTSLMPSSPDQLGELHLSDKTLTETDVASTIVVVHVGRTLERAAKCPPIYGGREGNPDRTLLGRNLRGVTNLESVVDSNIRTGVFHEGIILL